jgi:hypothetical protein
MEGGHFRNSASAIFIDSVRTNALLSMTAGTMGGAAHGMPFGYAETRERP